MAQYVFHTFLCTRISLSFKIPYAFSSVWRQNACVLLAFLHRLRRLKRFPPYGVTMRVFYSRFYRHYIAEISLNVTLNHNHNHKLAFLHRFRRLTRFPPYGVIMRVFHRFICINKDARASQCVCFSRYSALAFLHRLRRLTRFPPYGVIMRVFFTFLYTSVFLSFKTPYAFSSVWRHNTCVSIAFLHRLRRLMCFPPNGVILFVFHTFICIV